MKSTVKKWGNSAAVRIPKSVMQATHLHLDEVVDVQEDGGRIIIQPVRQSTYDLDDLLKRITPKNLHEAVDFGPPQGFFLEMLLGQQTTHWPPLATTGYAR